MDIRETVQKVLQEMVVPDLGRIRDENAKILALLDLTNKRLDDVNTHLADQSRRIDEVRMELSQRIDDTNKRIDDTNSRIDELRTELTQRIDDTNKRIDETNQRLGQRIDNVYSELLAKMQEVHSDLINRLDSNNARIDRFFESSVTKVEHEKMDERVSRLEREVEELRRRIAA